MYKYLYKIYILQNMFYSKTDRESKPKIRRSCVPNLRLTSQKICFRWDNLGVVPSFSTRWPSNPISNQIRVAPFPYMVWVTWNMFFLTFLNIYDVDITFRSIKDSMAVFDFNSTSKKHKKSPGRSCCIKKWEPIVFSYIQNVFRHFFSKNRMNVIFRTLDMNMNGYFCWFFMIFIYVSLFQSKGQNSLSESDEYSPYKLINYSCIVKYKRNQSPNMKTRVFKLSNEI